MGDTQKQYISAGTVDTGTREIEGDIWRREDLGGVGTSLTLTWIISGLVGKLGCVKHCVFVKYHRQLEQQLDHPEGDLSPTQRLSGDPQCL